MNEIKGLQIGTTIRRENYLLDTSLNKKDNERKFEISPLDSGRNRTGPMTANELAKQLSKTVSLSATNANSNSNTNSNSNFSKSYAMDNKTSEYQTDLLQSMHEIEHANDKYYSKSGAQEISFPHILETQRCIRHALAGVGEGTFQQKVMKAIVKYITGCRDIFEDVILHSSKCRKLARSLARTLDLIHSVSSTFSDSDEYLHRVSELVAIYISFELSNARDAPSQKPLIANRIANMINKHLKVPNEETTKSNILRMFVFIPKMFKQREIMTKIFEEFIVKSPVTTQNEFSDKIYVQYLLVFHQWKQLETDAEEQVHIVDLANTFMRPSKNLCLNANYACHLPKYETRRTATKFILNNLKFFKDLRNASIFDNCPKSCSTGIVDLCDDDDNTEKNADDQLCDFAETVEAIKVNLNQRINSSSGHTEMSTIDLTFNDQDECDDGELEWLLDLSNSALRFKAVSATVRSTTKLSPSKKVLPDVINLDSDGEDVTSSDIQEPELFSLDFEELERTDADESYCDAEQLMSNRNYDDYNNELLSDIDLSSIDLTKMASHRLKENIRTYAKPKEWQGSYITKKTSSICSSTSSLSSKLFKQLNDISCSSSSKLTKDVNKAAITNDLPEMLSGKATIKEDADGKIVDDVAAGPEIDLKGFATDDSNATDRQTRSKKVVKKRVKFNTRLIGPTRSRPSNSLTLPAKPAINTTKSYYQRTLRTAASYETDSKDPFPAVSSSAPSSSTTATSTAECSEEAPSTSVPATTATTTTTTMFDSLKQMAQKERINTIAAVFSSYDLLKDQRNQLIHRCIKNSKLTNIKQEQEITQSKTAISGDHPMISAPSNTYLSGDSSQSAIINQSTSVIIIASERNIIDIKKSPVLDEPKPSTCSNIYIPKLRKCVVLIERCRIIDQYYRNRKINEINNELEKITQYSESGFRKDHKNILKRERELLVKQIKLLNDKEKDNRNRMLEFDKCIKQEMARKVSLKRKEQLLRNAQREFFKRIVTIKLYSSKVPKIRPLITKIPYSLRPRRQNFIAKDVKPNIKRKWHEPQDKKESNRGSHRPCDSSAGTREDDEDHYLRRKSWRDRDKYRRENFKNLDICSNKLQNFQAVVYSFGKFLCYQNYNHYSQFLICITFCSASNDFSMMNLGVFALEA